MDRYQPFLLQASKAFDNVVAATLELYGAPVIRTAFSHSVMKDDVIDGTQKKGLIVDVMDGMDMDLLRDRVFFVVEQILKSIKKDVFECRGCNGYLLNWANITTAPPNDPGVICRAKVSIRGCPTIVAEGFDFAKANAELYATMTATTALGLDVHVNRGYGYDLLCHPSFVKTATPEV